MSFSIRMQLFAVLQVVLTALLTYFFVTNEYRDLSQQNLDALESFLIEQKQQELKNYTTIATSAIDHIYDVENEYDAKRQVAKIISRLIYNNNDGYFFVYDKQGTNIVHPTEPYRVGQNYWDLVNDKNEPTIQILIGNAQNGGDFYRYPWNQPTTNTVTEKLSYSALLPQWQWMIGTGVYLDNVNQQLASIQSTIDKHIDNTRFIILFVALSSIFGIFIVGAVLHFTQKKESDKKIHQLGQKIVSLKEEEQRHISRELHDGIVQVLVSIKYSLEATCKHLGKQDIPKPQPLSQAQHNLSNAITEIRRISHHLHPRILDELGLAAALDALGSECSERTGLNITINKPALSKLLPDHINITLYRVVQESLMNIEKHAHASDTIITLTIVDNWLNLSIVDNGIGMQKAQFENPSENGIGTRNLAERVEYHSGIFEMKSSNKGTTILVKIPRSAFANHYNPSHPEQTTPEPI